MRVKFGRRIYLCTLATHPTDSNLLILTTSNGVYTVDLLTSYNAEQYFNDLLKMGYCDVSEYEYSN